ncbi:MAG: hypothetical protein CMJ76_10680 [Planctomycetaceae bacterium]|nr:hypothetical protein [Planctomycetaceae bacterium]
MYKTSIYSVLLVPLVLIVSRPASAQSGFEFYQKPILYQTSLPDNPISRLQQQLDSGEQSLTFDPKRGYLDSLLDILDIKANTQALVYSKTSLQLRPISPSNPRALYYNDEVYIGWVPGSSTLELIAADPKLGSVFYTLQQTSTESVQFVRDRGECLQCHANRRTKEVPGPLVRSLYTSASGQPVYNFGNFLSDHTSPLEQRWGGYYVTGSHGKMIHMGNLFISRDADLDSIDYSRGANRLVLSKNVNSDNYPTDSSDIVALMVLEHQTQMQNLLTRAIYEERRGKHYDTTFNLDDQQGSEFTQRRITRSVDNLLKYMFFVDEFPLASVVTGTSSFTRDFTRRQPKTPEGASLFQLDLTERMFKYPLSYMIYSRTFRALGPKTSNLLQQRVKEILLDEPSNIDAEQYKHLTLEQKSSIREILKGTHPSLGQLFR